MGNNLSAIMGFLTSVPGTWVLHLIPGSALVLLIVQTLLRKNEVHNPIQRKHLLIGGLVLSLLQLFSIAINLIYRVSESIQLSTFQIFESAFAIMTILWVIWTMLIERNKTVQTGLTLMLNAVVVGFCGLSLLSTRFQDLLPVFSLNALIILWQLIAFLLVGIGITLILVRRPQQWILGALILLCLGVGHGIELVIGSDSPGSMVWIQFAQTVSLPWLLILVQRLTQKTDQQQSQNQVAPVVFQSQHVDTKPELVDLLLQINLQNNAAERFQATVRALSLSLVSDICYLVRILPEGDQIELIAGYDLIREMNLPTPILQREELLHIMDAWAEQRVLRLSQAYAEVQDVVTLTMLLKYHRIGNLLAYPLHLPNEPVIGGIIIFSPYTNKFFDSGSLHLLDEVQETLAQVLFGQNPIDEVNAELKQKIELETILRRTTKTLTNVLSDKETMIASLRTELQQYKTKYQIEKFETMQQIDALQQELHSLRVQPTPQEGLLRRMEHLSSQLRQLTEERDQLKTALTRAEARIKHLENQAGQTGPTRISTDNQIISLDSIAANVRLQIATPLQNKAQHLEIINPDGRQMVKTDPELLQAILQGLLENAIAVTPYEDEIQLRLEISLETGMLIAEITDHGEGLTHDEQTLLFSATESIIPGIGSLPAIRSAIRAIRVLNGKIWLRSTKHRSTTFRVQFPIRIID